jgi:lysophospholipase L1-like esterase
MGYSNWESDVRAYEDQNAPQNPIVFYGSSTMRRGDSLQTDFAGKTMVNRGFGGSNVAEAAHFVPRLILPLQPRQIVFYSGENDLAQGKGVPQIQRDYQKLLAAVRAGSDAPIAFMSVKPSWARWEYKPKMDKLNIWLRDWCDADESLTYIDVVEAMLENGEPRRELWVEDGVHLTPAGYELWAKIVRPYLI